MFYYDIRRPLCLKRSSNCLQRYKKLFSMPNLSALFFRKNTDFMFYNIFFAQKRPCLMNNSYICITFVFFKHPLFQN